MAQAIWAQAFRAQGACLLNIILFVVSFHSTASPAMKLEVIIPVVVMTCCSAGLISVAAAIIVESLSQSNESSQEADWIAQLQSAECTVGNRLTSPPRCETGTYCKEYIGKDADKRCYKREPELRCWCPVALNVSSSSAPRTMEVAAGYERDDLGRDRSAWCREVLGNPPLEEVLTYNAARESWRCRRDGPCAGDTCKQCVSEILPGQTMKCVLDGQSLVRLGSKEQLEEQARAEAGESKLGLIFGGVFIILGLCVVCCCVEFIKDQRDDAEEAVNGDGSEGGGLLEAASGSRIQKL